MYCGIRETRNSAGKQIKKERVYESEGGSGREKYQRGIIERIIERIGGEGP